MGFWHHVQTAAGMGGNYHWGLAAGIAGAFALAAVAPESRRRLRTAVLLIVLSVLGTLLCALLLAEGVDPSGTGYRALDFISQLLFGASVINLLGVLVFRVVLARLHLTPAPILHDTVLGLAYIAAALTLLARHGVDLGGIIATSAVVTAVIGFSLQDTLGNIMGGVALQLERSVAVGDWVRVGELEGLVREIRWRQTSIETRNWDTVVVPNSVLMKSQVTVLGRREGMPRLHRMWVKFHVDYRHPPPEVIDAVRTALRADSIPNVAAEPAPDCILYDFTESYATFAVRYWLKDFARDDPTSSEVRSRIFTALQRAGVGLSIPAQRVFLTHQGREREARKHREELAGRVSALKGVKVLRPLTDDEREELAGRLTVAPYCRGEVVMRQGNTAHNLYIVSKGQAEVSVSVADGESRAVKTLGPGDFFGEMGLMTGEPRTATVTALTPLVCYRLDKDGFADVLRRRPEVAEAMSHLLADHKLELTALAEDLNAEAMKHRMIAHTQEDLLDKIRRFFTLS